MELAHLPLTKKSNLCQILDQNDCWEELGMLMQFSEFEIAVSFALGNSVMSQTSAFVY